MKLSEIKENILIACDRLLRAEMIARTWGNVSGRVDENHFIITPSGRDYRNLTSEELVLVNISDGGSWGDILPSSEKGLHLDIYRNNPRANYIIHTHQPEASVLSAIGTDIMNEVEGSDVFQRIPCAAYGFPGSDELRHNVVDAMNGNFYSMALMAHHGAICVGKEISEALHHVATMEMLSLVQINKAYEDYFGIEYNPEESVYAKILKESFGVEIPEAYIPLYKSERKGDTMIYYLPGGKNLSLSMEDPAPVPAQRIHQAIYKARPDIGGILHDVAPSAVAYSLLKRPLGAYLDDFAQINGAEMQWAPVEEEAIVAALGENHGVLLENNGALCCGSSLYDAESLLTVLEKNARSFLIGQLFPDTPIKTVPREECEKMREFYLQSYSKRF